MARDGARGLGRWVRLAPVAFLYLALFAGQVVLTKLAFTDRFPGGNDFYPRWAGGCSRFWTGEDPYSEGTTLAIQEGVYGRPALPNEDQVAFAYPLHILFFIWPTCLFQSFAWVQPIWMTVLVHLTVAGTVLARRAAGWRAPRALWMLTIGWAVFVYPNARAILLGQPSLLVFVFLMAALVLIWQGHSGWAGAALAAATVKPQMVILVVPWLLWWSAWTGRWRVLKGFGAALAVLLGSATLLQPGWWVAFANQLVVYTSYTEFGSGFWIIFTHLLQSPQWVEGGMTALLLIGCAMLAWRERSSEYAGMLWMTSIMLLATHFVAPRTATTHFAVYLLPLFMIFEMWRQMHSQTAAVRSVALLSLVLVGSWWLFAATVEGIQESAINYLPIPILLAFALLLRRAALVTSAAVVRR